MKAQEKELIYNLLKTADAYNSGYTRAKFVQNFEFLDDDEGSISEEVANSSITETPSAETVIPIPQENKSEKAGLSLDELSAKILRCTRCGLARTRNNVVPGEGVSSPLVLVIGEGPGYVQKLVEGFIAEMIHLDEKLSLNHLTNQPFSGPGKAFGIG